MTAGLEPMSFAHLPPDVWPKPNGTLTTFGIAPAYNRARA